MYSYSRRQTSSLALPHPPSQSPRHDQYEIFGLASQAPQQMSVKYSGSPPPSHSRRFGGGGGIRTHGGFNTSPVFKTGAINHSTTPPDILRLLVVSNTIELCFPTFIAQS